MEGEAVVEPLINESHEVRDRDGCHIRIERHLDGPIIRDLDRHVVGAGGVGP